MENIRKIFSENLRSLMEQYNCKSVDLARKLNVGKPCISNYRKGRSIPDAEIMKKISYFFCCPINLLLTPRTGKFRESVESPLNNVVALIPYFQTCLAEQYDDIYIEENYQSCFYFPMNIRDKSRCYAVKMYAPDSIEGDGFPAGCIAVYSRDEEITLKKNKIFAVHLKEKARIVIRKVHIVDENTIHLVSDTDTIHYSLTEENKEIEILGEVVFKLSHL